MKSNVVPVSGPKIYPEDIELVVQAVKEGWFTEGKYCARFAHKLEQYTGFKHCVLCNSGSSANLLAVTTAIRLSKYRSIHNPLIVTCATGFPTTIFPILQCGAIPLFVDVDKDTLNIDIEAALVAMQDLDAVGIITSHTLGFPFDEKRLAEKAEEYGMFLISDASDALGAKIGDYHVGKLSNTTTLSFFPAHHITSGEGGAILTDDDETAEYLTRFCSWGRDCRCLPGQDNTCGNRFDGDYGTLPHGYDHKYVFSEIGYNLKMTELQGALGLAQMNHVYDFVSERNFNLITIMGSLKNFDKKFTRIKQLENSKISPFGLPLVLKEEYNARDLVKFLQEQGIESRPIFAGNILRQPVIKRMNWQTFGSMDNSDYLMEHAIWVGTHPSLTDEHLERMVNTLNDYIKQSD